MRPPCAGVTAAVRLARAVLHTKPAIWRETSPRTPLLLSASAYFKGEELIDVLLQMAYRKACFETSMRRAAAAFKRQWSGAGAAVPELEEMVAVAVRLARGGARGAPRTRMTRSGGAQRGGRGNSRPFGPAIRAGGL